ncbi:MAG: VOC family protein [Dehalococcoidales bacterium]|nr:VOC family protein [Dehalococcoidales bacterium]
MEFGSINLVVHDVDKALNTYLKLFGTNNIPQVLRLKGMTDGEEVVDGYLLKIPPVNLGIYKPRGSSGTMGRYLQKYGEGIHHITMHLGQDEFEDAYHRLKDEGFKVSARPTFWGKFSETAFWLEEGGPQGVPVQFVTKGYHGLKIWKEVNYLDAPQKVEEVNITQQYIMPRVTLGTIMVTTSDWENQAKIWSKFTGRPILEVGNLTELKRSTVVDGRGNQFIPVKFRFSWGGAINLYVAVNEDAPINKVMAKRGQTVMYHNMCCYVVRDKPHEYWRKLDAAGFNMVDPKPYLHPGDGTENYFYFVHPSSTHGVLIEIVSAYYMDENFNFIYDWSDVKTYTVSPLINGPSMGPQSKNIGI